MARMFRETGEPVYRDACERMLNLAEKWQELPGGLTYTTGMTGDMKYTNYAIQVWRDYKAAVGGLGYNSMLAVDGVFALLEALEREGLLGK